VLLDMETPLMDECQAAKHLRSDYLSDDCLIIAFTESVDGARRTPCIEADIDLLLRKPVDQDVVETLLMLECLHVNRRRAWEAVNKLNRPTSTDHRPIYARRKPY
jgi:CheY-like chemotaxis protein